MQTYQAPPQAYQAPPQAYRPPPQAPPQAYQAPPQAYQAPPRAPPQAAGPTEEEIMARFGLTEDDLELMGSPNDSWLGKGRVAEYRMYSAAVFAVACVVVAVVWAKNVIWAAEPGGDGGEDPDYTPPELDEDDLVGGSEQTSLFDVVLSMALLVFTILMGMFTIYMFVTKALKAPSPWVGLFLVVYGLVMFIVLEWEQANVFVGGARGAMERALISAVFGTAAMVMVVVALRVMAKDVEDEQQKKVLRYVMPVTGVVVGMLMGHTIFTKPDVSEFLDEFVLADRRVYIVPVFTTMVFAVPLMVEEFRKSVAMVPWVITAGAVAMMFYLMGMVHTRFGKFRLIAGVGTKDPGDPCAGCDIFHEFVKDKTSRVHTYAQAVCDPAATTAAKTKYRAKVLANFDVVARTNPKECNAFCAKSKQTIKELKCKCERGDDDVCGSVADLQLYWDYDRYKNNKGFIDENYNLTASSYEILAVGGMGLILMMVLSWNEMFSEGVKIPFFGAAPPAAPAAGGPAVPPAAQAPAVQAPAAQAPAAAR